MYSLRFSILEYYITKLLFYICVAHNSQVSNVSITDIGSFLRLENMPFDKIYDIM